MTLDVILTCYNSEDYIERCISSILNQTFSEFDLYVFDDCSTDKTLDVVKSLRDSRVTIISSKKNIGPYASKNFVFKNFCSARYIALHDADDYSKKDRFEEQMKFMEKKRDNICGCVGTAIHEFGDYKDRNVYPKKLKKNMLNKMSDALDNNYQDCFNLKFCMNGSIMLRSDILEQLGGWDGKTRIGGDTDLFLRMLPIVDVCNLQKALYFRRMHSKSLTASKSHGFESKARKKYVLGLADIIGGLISGAEVKQNFYYPSFEYDVEYVGERCVV